MALETMKGLPEIDGFKIQHIGSDGQFATLSNSAPVLIDDTNNVIMFKIQQGPIKENGVNGCQVDTLIAVAHKMIEELNKKFSSVYNERAMVGLANALYALDERRKDREKRNVEGTSQA